MEELVGQKTILESYQKQEVTETGGKPRKTGIDIIGDIPWGMHLCQFYETKEDLIDILVPYFKAGLENNEFCMWVTSPPLDEEEAKEAMRKAVPDFERYLERGQIEIVPHTEWYLKDGAFNLQRVLNAWIDKLNQALARGYDGIRVTGNTAWLEKKDWADFADYEEEVNNAIGEYRMIAICTYSLDRCEASEIMDVVGNHQFALIRREGNWELIESSERNRAEEALRHSEEKYKGLVNNVKLGVFRSTLETPGKFLEVNPAMEEITGYSREELLQMKVADLYVHPEERERTLKEIALTTGRTTRELSFRKKDGTEITVSDTKVPVRDSAGKILCFDGILEDITERRQAEEALRHSEENLRAYLESAPDGVYLNDLKGKFLYGNKKAEEIMGYKREELIGKSFLKLKLLPATYLAKASKLLALNAMGRPTGPDEFELTSKDGSRIWVEINTTPIKQLGEVVVLGFVRDITERKQAEVKLRESDERYKAIFESTNDMLVLIDRKGKILDVNQNIDEVGGYEREEIVGKSIMSLAKVMTKKSLAIMAKNFLKRMAGVNVPPYEIQMIKKNGELTSVEINAVALRKDGRIVGDLAILKDITERKQAEEALKESETKFKAIVENIDGVIFQLSPLGIIQYVSPQAQEVYGYKLEDLIGKHLKKTTPISELPKALAIIKSLLSGKVIKNLGINQVASNRKIVPMEINLTPVRKDGKIIAMQGVMRDITERKRAEEKEKQMQQQLSLTSRLASIGEMASGIAHEINNPLTGVIGFAQLLMQRDLPEDIRKDIEIINDGAQRVAGIISRLLTFARQHEPGREYVNINDAITSVLELRSYEMKVNNIEVTTQLAPHPPQTMADANQLQQVFLNIIINAEKEMTAAHHRGKLSVKTERLNSNIRVSFTDDGPGISKENLDKVFNPFFTTREVGNGTGLGLSVCHGIITQHSGRIYAQSKLGKGATFVVELPIVAETEQLEKAEAVQEEPWQCRGAKILVVDDEKSILDFLKRLLTEQGYQVETVDRTRAALTKLRREGYDLILLDIKLPGKGGIWLYRYIEAMDPALAQRVLLITGDVMETTTREFLDKTKVRYIAKPLIAEQLKRDINHMLTREPLRQQS